MVEAVAASMDVAAAWERELAVAVVAMAVVMTAVAAMAASARRSPRKPASIRPYLLCS